jgi:Xaa-Pro dipeptidase
MSKESSILKAEQKNELRAYRYERVRDAMREQGYEFLIAVGRYDAWQIGYLRYITDWRLWAGHGYAVFPVDGEPILVLPAQSQAYWARSQSWVETVGAKDPIAEVASQIRKRYREPATIAVCGLDGIMPRAEATALQRAFPKSELVERGELINRSRAIKSDLEITLMKEDAAAVQQAFETFKDELMPGRSEWEIVAEVHRKMRQQGGLDGIAHISHAEPPFIHPPTSRLIERNDVVKFSIEYTGPHGYWTELGGIFSFAVPTEPIRKRYETVHRAFDEASAMMRPGIIGGDIVDRIYRVYEEDGWTINGRGIWDVHGIGLDVIEWPTVIEGDDTQLESGMVLCLHPGLLIGDDKWGVYIQDSFVVTNKGGEPLSGLSHDWYVLER